MSLKNSQAEPQTLERLLARMRKDSHLKAKRIDDLATAANSVARYLGMRRDRIRIRRIVGIGRKFRQYLESSGVKKERVTTMMGHFRALLVAARDLGWSPQLFALEREWEPVRQALHGVSGGPAIVKDALARGIPVSRYSNLDLEEWAKRTIEQKRSYAYVRGAQSRFRKVLRHKNLGNRFPQFDLRMLRNDSIRLPVDEMPSSLRSEINAIVEWLSKRETPPRRNSWKSQILRYLEQFCGYAMLVEKMDPPTRFSSLLTSRYINNYVRWLRETAKCKKSTMVHKLHPVSLALRYYPAFADLDRNLCREALMTIPKDKRSDVVFKQREYLVHQSLLEKIVKELHQERHTRSDLNTKTKARLCHDELLMLFLTWYPWYPGCLRTCRFTGSSPNLFEGPIPCDVTPFALTAKVRKSVKANPNSKFWQFSFSAEETPNGYPAWGLMPEFFIDILEEYREEHHKELAATGTETLFVNREGKPLSHRAFDEIVGNIPLKHEVRRVTPTACRAIFAHHWLRKYPGDYENLAAILWMAIPSVRKVHDPDWRPGQYWKKKRSA